MEKSKNIHIFKTKYNKYNKETIEAINDTKNITKNPEKYKPFNSLEELIKDLDNYHK